MSIHDVAESVQFLDDAGQQSQPGDRRGLRDLDPEITDGDFVFLAYALDFFHILIIIHIAAGHIDGNGNRVKPPFFRLLSTICKRSPDKKCFT